MWWSKIRTRRALCVTIGLDKLLQYSDFISEERLRLYLSDSGKNGVTVKIHCTYQKTITNELKRKWDTVLTTSKKIRRVAQSDVTEFSWKTHCFYLGSPCIPDPKHPERKKIGDFCTFTFKQSVLKTWIKEMINKWAEEVRMRVLDCHGLVSLEAYYDIT